jgi:hypothetical protein
MAQRDEKGLFLAGHVGMGGRPARNIEEKYIYVLNEIVTPAKLGRLLAIILDQANEGCRPSQALVLKYVLPDLEKVRAAMEQQDAVCRVAGSTSREAFEREMIGRALAMALERQAADVKVTNGKKKPGNPI